MFTVRLKANGAGLCGPWNKADQVSNQFLEQSQQIMSGRQGRKKPTRHAAFQMHESISSAELVLVSRTVDRRSLQHRHRVKIIGKHFGPEILLCSQSRQARSILQHALWRCSWWWPGGMPSP